MAVIKGIIVEQSTPLDLNELAQALHTENDILIAMVEHRLLEPSGHSPSDWKFDDICFKRAKIATSFYHDLEINMPGIALALDLLDKIERLEKRLEILKRFEEE